MDWLLKDALYLLLRCSEMRLLRYCRLKPMSVMLFKVVIIKQHFQRLVFLLSFILLMLILLNFLTIAQHHKFVDIVLNDLSQTLPHSYLIP